MKHLEHLQALYIHAKWYYSHVLLFAKLTLCPMKKVVEQILNYFYSECHYRCVTKKLAWGQKSSTPYLHARAFCTRTVPHCWGTAWHRHKQSRSNQRALLWVKWANLCAAVVQEGINLATSQASSFRKCIISTLLSNGAIENNILMTIDIALQNSYSENKNI